MKSVILSLEKDAIVRGDLILKLTCMHCGDAFEGTREKFCSSYCKYSHISELDKKISEAVNADSGHTDKFSKP